MKTLHNYLLLLTVMFIMVSCATTENTTQKQEDSTAEKEALHLADDDKWKQRSELDDFIQKHEDDLYYIITDTTSELHKEWESLTIAAGGSRKRGEQTEEETIRFDGLMDSLYNIDISPNPTSTSVKLKFFTNWGAERDNLFPKDITVDLYYLDQKNPHI